MFVTHDIDEAIRMGSRIAIMRAGRLVQYDTPEAILANPADAFVEEFVGSDRVLKRLSLLNAGSYAEHVDGAATPSLRLNARASLREALTILLVNGADATAIVDDRDSIVGVLTLARIRSAIHAHERDGNPAQAQG